MSSIQILKVLSKVIRYAKFIAGYDTPGVIAELGCTPQASTYFPSSRVEGQMMIRAALSIIPVIGLASFSLIAFTKSANAVFSDSFQVFERSLTGSRSPLGDPVIFTEEDEASVPGNLFFARIWNPPPGVTASLSDASLLNISNGTVHSLGDAGAGNQIWDLDVAGDGVALCRTVCSISGSNLTSFGPGIAFISDNDALSPAEPLGVVDILGVTLGQGLNQRNVILEVEVLSGGIGPSIVPEPGSISLLTAGILALPILRRKLKRARIQVSKQL